MITWVVLVILKKLSFRWFLKNFVCFFFVFYFVFAENNIRIESTRRLRRGPVGLSVEVHVNFDKNLTMLVEKFWNASTERLNQVNAAIDASNFYFNMLEIFQMYFTFPSFKNIATQRYFNKIIHFPLHCLKSTFRSEILQKVWKMILRRSFQLSSKSIFPLQISCRKSK